MTPELYAEVDKVVHDKDPKYVAAAKSDPNDPTTVTHNWGVAVAVA
jgi:hypothetical protein